jgi:hypothetical protein
MIQKFLKPQTATAEKMKPKGNPVTGTKLNVPSVQSWLPFYDVNAGFLWRRDSHIVAAVSIEPINLGLLSEKEQKRRIHLLFEILNSMEENWSWTILQRPVDLDEYIAKKEEQRNQETHYIRRRILDSGVRNAAIVASSGEAIELMFYFLLTGNLSKKQALDMQDLNNRINELSENLTQNELQSHVCDNQEIRELEFIFLNPLQAAFERAPTSDGYTLPPLISSEVHYG